MTDWIDKSTDCERVIKETFVKTKDLEYTILKCLIDGIYVAGGGVEQYRKKDFINYLGISKYKVDKVYKSLQLKGLIWYARYGGQTEDGDPYVYGAWEINRSISKQYLEQLDILNKEGENNG